MQDYQEKVTHGNGVNAVWDTVQASAVQQCTVAADDAQQWKIVREERQLHVLTVVSDADNPHLLKLIRGAALHGLRVEALISKQAFGARHGWGPRLRLLYKHLDNLRPTDVLMFVDGYDVLIDGSAADILGRFDSLLHGAPKVLFSAESVCWPDRKVASRYPLTNSPYKYLNGGGYMATVTVLRAALDAHFDFKSKEFETCDDQREWTRAFLNSEDIVLDTSNTIFNSLYGRTDDLVATPRGWFNKVTESYPLVFHGNGRMTDFLFGVVQPGLRCASAFS